MSVPVEETIRKFALQNAVLYKGRANPKSVVGKVLGECPELRPRAKEVIPLAESIVAEVNAMPEASQRMELELIDPSLLQREKVEKVTTLPELEGAEKGKVVMRFAPGPSGPLHIGHTRVAILNDEYVKRYEGVYINRVEDTNPEKIDPEAYRMIPEDLEWLGVDVHKTIIQSDRFELYYDVTRKLLEDGHAYVCTCPAEEWRARKEACRACPDRDLPHEEQLERFDRMLEGGYGEGEAVVVVKTDLAHPNPAIRDFIALRIVDAPHPRTGTRYHVYPMMNLSVAVDDHHLGLTHVLRGKDHLNNTLRQAYIFHYFRWKVPHYYHYGLVSVPDTILKTSLIKEGIGKGDFEGWDDVRTGTLRAMMRRGISPDAIRRYWVDVGLKEVDIQFSWDNLFAMNKEIVDPEASRYFFVWDPVKVEVTGVEHLEAQAPIHPDHPERGVRRVVMSPPLELYLTPEDHALLEGSGRVRLKDLCNLSLEGGEARCVGNDLSVLKEGVRIVHWAPRDSVPCEVLMPDGTTREGLVEEMSPQELGQVVQFERFGFVRVESLDPVRAVYAHR